MTIASRTPEGFPSRCPVCGQATEIEFSDPGDDAPCPNCGELLLLSAQILEHYRPHLALLTGVPSDRLTADTQLGPLHDSISMVEVAMMLESDHGLAPDLHPFERFQTVGDFLRYCLRRHGNRSP